MGKRILAAIVTFNRKELLKECLNSLFRQTYNSFDILVVDNASTDGTEKELKSLVDNGSIYYHRNEVNIGGAGGFNIAMRMAVERGYDYVWVMDDDTIPSENALYEIIKTIRTIHRSWGFISGRVLWTDGRRCSMNEQKLFWNGYCRQATFVSMMIPTRIIREVGLPIKDFFIWGDDVEYSRRISAKYPCYISEKSIAIHKTANNEGSNIARDSIDRIDRYRYAYRNEVYIAKKEGIFRIIYQICKILLHFFRVMFYSENHRIDRIRIIVEGTVDGFGFDPEIEYI